MGLYSTPSLKYLAVALLLLVYLGSSATADRYNEEALDATGSRSEAQQQGRSCEPERLSSCQDFLEGRRERPSERCCQELQRTPSHCRCQVIQRVMDQSLGSQGDQRRHRSEEEEGERFDERRQVERASQLPNTCGVHQTPRRCDIRRRSLPARIFMRGSNY